MNATRESRSVMLPIFPNDFCTADHTQSFMASTLNSEVTQLPFVRPMVPVLFTHSEDPSYPLCQVSPSSELSCFIFTSSTTSPLASRMTSFSALRESWLGLFTRVKLGFTTRNSPWASVPDSSVFSSFFLDSRHRVYPVRSMAPSVLFRISTHSLPRSVPAGFDSYSLMSSPVCSWDLHLSSNPASNPTFTPRNGTGMLLSASPTPGMSLSVTPSS